MALILLHKMIMDGMPSDGPHIARRMTLSSFCLNGVADAGDTIVLVRKHLDLGKAEDTEPTLTEKENKKECLNDDDQTCIDQPAIPI